MADKNSLWTWDNQQKYHEKIMQEIEDNATGGTGSLTIDTELSDTSENPVQNKVIKAELDKKLEADDLPETKNITNEALGEVITVTDAVEEPLLGLSIYGKSTQDGTPSPTNPVPIVSVGDDGELKVQSCGKNLFDFEAWKTKLLNASWQTTNGTMEWLDVGFKITATSDDCYTNQILSSGIYRFPVKSNTTYTFRYDFEGTDIKGTTMVFLNGIVGGDNIKSVTNDVHQIIFVTKSDTTFVTIRFAIRYSGDYGTFTNFQLEEGSTATDYEPYTGSTAVITSVLPLCGKDGVYDELIYRPNKTGKAVKRYGIEIFDGSADEYWAMSNNNKRIVTDKLSKFAKPTAATNAIALCLCDKLAAKSADDTYAGVEGISFDTTARVGISLTALTGNSDLSAWTAFLAEKPITVLYELATPEEIELTADEMAQIKQLYSYNGVTNIFNDEGAEMSVKYWCDNSIANLLENKAEKEHSHLVSDIEDFPTSLPASDVSAWAKAETKPTYTASEVGADTKGSADTALASAKSYADTKDTATLNSAKSYTDSKIDAIVGEGAAETLDTIGEISGAIEENQDMLDTLNSAIGNKANVSDLTSHTGNTTVHITATERTNWNTAKTHADSTHARTDATKVEKSTTNGNIKINGTETVVYTHPTGTNPHGTTKSDVGLGNVPNVATNDQTPTYSDTTTLATLVSGEKLSVALSKIKLAITNLINHIANKSNPHAVTKAQVGLGNVENKSSATIRDELTKDNVTKALGYTPPTTNTTYSTATSTTLGLVKSGTDITVDANGNVSVNDDSHSHIIANIDNLQDTLNAKLPQSTITTVTDLNTLQTTGVYHIKVANCTNTPSSCWGTVYVDFSVGTSYQIYIEDGKNANIYKRGYSSSAWTEWVKVNPDTKNTAGSTDTSSKIFLVGATSQAANPQTYSDNQVYATNGQLNGNTMRVAEKVTMSYNATTESLDFTFA